MARLTPSAAELKRVSSHGFSLLIGDEELRLPFKRFPWFRRATIDQLSHVEWHAPGHLYWPTLAVDLSVDFIREEAAQPTSAISSISTQAPVGI
jgi:hypothetical protein